MDLNFRKAVDKDIPSLVELLADDELGQKREDPSIPLNHAYFKALEQISIDPNNALIVVENKNKLIGMLQLTFIPSLTYIGSKRCLIEGVRIHKDHRGQGFGVFVFKWAIDQAKREDCRLIQLTSDKQRPRAIEFYKSLGFQATHEGLKMNLW